MPELMPYNLICPAGHRHYTPERQVGYRGLMIWPGPEAFVFKACGIDGCDLPLSLIEQESEQQAEATE